MRQSIVVFEYITSGAPDYILFQTLWSCDNLFTLVVLVPMLYQSLQYLSMSPLNQIYCSCTLQIFEVVICLEESDVLLFQLDNKWL